METPRGCHHPRHIWSWSLNPHPPQWIWSCGAVERAPGSHVRGRRRSGRATRATRGALEPLITAKGAPKLRDATVGVSEPHVTSQGLLNYVFGK